MHKKWLFTNLFDLDHRVRSAHTAEGQRAGRGIQEPTWKSFQKLKLAANTIPLGDNTKCKTTVHESPPKEVIK